MNSQEIGRKKKKNKQTSAKGMNSQEIGRKIRRNYTKSAKQPENWKIKEISPLLQLGSVQVNFPKWLFNIEMSYWGRSNMHDAQRLHTERNTQLFLGFGV